MNERNLGSTKNGSLIFSRRFEWVRRKFLYWLERRWFLEGVAVFFLWGFLWCTCLSDGCGFCRLFFNNGVLRQYWFLLSGNVGRTSFRSSGWTFFLYEIGVLKVIVLVLLWCCHILRSTYPAIILMSQREVFLVLSIFISFLISFSTKYCPAMLFYQNNFDFTRQ